MNIKVVNVGLLSMAIAAGFGASANAAVTTYNSLASWQAPAQNFNETQVTGAVPFNTATVINNLADGSTLSNLNPETQVRLVGDGWATWQGAPNPTVYWTQSSAVLSADFNPGNVSGNTVDAFGFYAEGDNSQLDDITLLLSDDSSLTQTVNGDAGAEFFGWVGSGITSITVSTNDGDSFAIGDFWEGYSIPTPVPEPLTVSLFGAGLAGAALMRRRKKA